MPRFIQLAKPFKPDRLTPVLRIKGVNVFVHWSVFVIAAIMLLGTIRRPVMTFVGVACYLSVILIHECGHMVAAQLKGYAVDGIFLYPIHGLCTFQMPWSRFDQCVIAWGGVAAQALVALPLIVWLAVFGYTRFAAVNAVLAILGCYSLLVAVFNLIPAGRLDGRLAWGLIPEWIARIRNRRKRPRKRTADWRTY
jgi:stage IV sporulation protein FB